MLTPTSQVAGPRFPPPPHPAVAAANTSPKKAILVRMKFLLLQLQAGLPVLSIHSLRCVVVNGGSAMVIGTKGTMVE